MHSRPRQAVFVFLALVSLLAGAPSFSQDVETPQENPETVMGLVGLKPLETAENPMGGEPLHYRSLAKSGSKPRLTAEGQTLTPSAESTDLWVLDGKPGGKGAVHVLYEGTYFGLGLWLERADLMPGLVARTFLTLPGESPDAPHWVELSPGSVSVDEEAYARGDEQIGIERENIQLAVKGLVARKALDEVFEVRDFEWLENHDAFLPETTIKNPAGHVVASASLSLSGRVLRAASEPDGASLVHVVTGNMQAIGEVESMSPTPLGLGLSGIGGGGGTGHGGPDYTTVEADAKLFDGPAGEWVGRTTSAVVVLVVDKGRDRWRAFEVETPWGMVKVWVDLAPVAK